MSAAILALDASAAACSVAVLTDGDIVAWREAAMDRGHAEALMPLVMEAMTEAKLDFGGLAKIAVGVGPGSFTGIRIALAAARGIGLASDRPVIGIDSFSAVASTVPASELAGRSLLVVIESKREELFAQYFASDLHPLGEPLVLPGSDVLARRPSGDLLVAGDAAARFVLPPGAVRFESAGRPEARAIARLASEGRVILAPRPLYLRGADVTLPSGNGRPAAR